MRTIVDLPDDLFRRVEARAAVQGRPIKDLVADALNLILKAPGGHPDAPAGERGNAGAWARRFAGVASLAPGESTDDARADHYQKKYGI